MRFMRTIITNKKPFGLVKKGDMLYTLTYHRTTIQIHKFEVNHVELRGDGRTVRINFGDNSHLYVDKDETWDYETYEFGKWVVTTTLEEAQKICKEMTNEKIREHKKMIKVTKEKIKKWEDFKKKIDSGIYNIF